MSYRIRHLCFFIKVRRGRCSTASALQALLQMLSEFAEPRCLTDLLLPRGSTKYKEQLQKLLESQPAVKKDRAGELALGNSFLGLPGAPGSGWRLGGWPAEGPGGGSRGRGRGEVAWVEGLGAGKRGRPGNSKNAILPAHEAFFLHFFCMFFAFPKLGVIFFAFFCISQIGSHFFCISQAGSQIFAIFSAFPGPGLPPSPVA